MSVRCVQGISSVFIFLVAAAVKHLFGMNGKCAPLQSTLTLFFLLFTVLMHCGLGSMGPYSRKYDDGGGG